MAKSINAHFLLSGNDPASFIKVITPSDAERGKLTAARAKIRAHLRQSFQQLSQDIDSQRQVGLVDAKDPKSAPLKLRPKFAPQGSFVYGTLNSPAQKPPQEMDLDDGMYLPLEALDSVAPRVASKLLFKVVGDMLDELCTRNPGWSVVRKSTCCRVCLPFDAHAHIDIPLYAYPEEYEQHLTEAMAKDGAIAVGSVSFQEPWKEVVLDSDKVWLAHRDNDWQQSDPKKIRDWFEEKVSEHGEQLRRICRYLKAWRDNHFKQGGVPSIALMAHAVHVFDRVRMNKGRDDLALLRVAEQLPGLLAEKVENPTISANESDPSKYLDGNLTDIERQKAVAEAKEFRLHLTEAFVENVQRQRAVDRLRLAFGSRIADRIDLVHVEASEDEVTKVAASVLAPAVIPHISRSA